jgi:iron(III) transport system substrate-binding protein
VRRRTRAVAMAATAVAAAALISSCGVIGGDDGPSITVYNAQHEDLLNALAPAWTDKTGIDVKLHNGEDFELANQLVQEGSSSPADVFLTENSPAMSLVDSKGLLAPLPRQTLAQVPSQYEPSDGNWTGFAARSTVLVYNTSMVSPDQLPTSIMDLADPEWAGRIAFSPSGADFQAIVSAVLKEEGEQATADWLAGLKANGKIYDGNDTVLQAVNSGDVAAGIIYHYYWYRDQAESEDNSDNTQLYFFGNRDPGAFVSVSGAGVLKSSDKQKDAQSFVKYLSSVAGQQKLADSDTLEYPLNPAVDLGRGVKPFAELDPPVIDPSTLNGPEVITLLQNAGLL